MYNIYRNLKVWHSICNNNFQVSLQRIYSFILFNSIGNILLFTVTIPITVPYFTVEEFCLFDFFFVPSNSSNFATDK